MGERRRTGLGRTAFSTLTQPVAVPLATTTSSEPPSDHNDLARGGELVDERGRRGGARAPHEAAELAAVRREHERGVADG